MGRKHAPLPEEAIAPRGRERKGQLEGLSAALRFQSTWPEARDRDLDDARRLIRSYRVLAADLARGDRVPERWTAEDAAETARLIEEHCTRLDGRVSRGVAAAFLSGLALGSLGARIGADPFIQRAASQAQIARDVALEKAQRTEARNECWRRRERELEAGGDHNRSSRARKIAAEVSAPKSPVTPEQVRRALYRGRKL